MMCRAPLLSQKNLHDLHIMVRLYWVQSMKENLTASINEGRSDLEIVAAMAQATDYYRPVMDPLVLWGFQLKAGKSDCVRTIMRPELHEEYLRMARHTRPGFDPLLMTQEVQAEWEDFEIGRLALIQTLEDAPSVDPELFETKHPPSGRTPPTLN